MHFDLFSMPFFYELKAYVGPMILAIILVS
jgi:hypothetical protein